MSAYSVNIAKHATLAANVVDVLTFTGPQRQLDVLSRGKSALFVSLGATEPVVNGDDCYVVPAGGSIALDFPPTTRTVKIVCATADDYSVTVSYLGVVY